MNAEDNTTESVAQPGIDVEGPREELMAVAVLVPEETVKELSTKAVIESTEVEGLTSGPLWDLLRRVGYQLW